MNTTIDEPVSPATAQQYRKTGLSLLLRAKAAGFADPVPWLGSLLNISPSTFRQYKASLRFVIREQGGPTDVLDALVRATPARPLPARTSRLRLRGTPPAKLEPLFDTLAKSGSRLAPFVILWIKAGTITGLCPSEWRQVTRVNQFLIEVVNQKSTRGRAHGPTRLLSLEAMPEEDRHIVESWIRVVSDQLHHWELFYNGCRAALRRVTAPQFGPQAKSITLLSARHQYVSNAKAKGWSKAKIAAALGHRSIESAGLHHGRKKNGLPDAPIATPSQRDIDRVTKFNRHRESPEGSTSGDHASDSDDSV